MADDHEEPMLEMHHDMEEDENNEDEDEEELGDPHEDDDGPTEFLDHEPTKQEKMDMRKANKRPSEWLRLLCAQQWSDENSVLVDGTDSKFMGYKPYLKGYLTCQLLCRLSLAYKENENTGIDLWGILGVQDEFDKSYIVAQVDRFCSLYNIRGPLEELDGANSATTHTTTPTTATTAAAVAAAAAAASTSPPSPPAVQWDALGDPTAMAAAAAAANGMPGGYDYATAAAVAAAAAAATTTDASASTGSSSPNKVMSPSKSKQQSTAQAQQQASEVNKAHRMAKDAEKALEQERRQNLKREQRRLSQEKREQKNREREQVAIRKAAEKIAREASREERRRKKLELRQQREKFAQEQKEAALKRAAELVSSNRVPIEITRGAAAAKAAAVTALQQSGVVTSSMVTDTVDSYSNSNNSKNATNPRVTGQKKVRSAIVVSTADDLHQIVTHSKNLWAKYNAIAKEHNQKVNWITVAKELGIHVKVREKYARMHSRAEQRGFDWARNGYYKIKDHPEIFLEPTQAEQKAKMPPPPPDTTTTVLISKDTNKEVEDQQLHHEPPPPAAATVAAAPGTTGVECNLHEHHHLVATKVEGEDMHDAAQPESNGVVHHPPPHAPPRSPHDQQEDPHHHSDETAAESAIASAAAIVDASGVGVGTTSAESSTGGPVVEETLVGQVTAVGMPLAPLVVPVADPTAAVLQEPTHDVEVS